MSQKRKLEEYHDPDYPQNSNEKIAKLSDNDNAKKIDKKQKICDILTKEFEKEMNTKEREIYEINHRICIARKMLHRVCYAVISNYYNKRNLNVAPEEVTQVQENISRLFTDERKGPQNAIHPSLKKILGSNEVNYKELLNSRPTRQAAKTAQSTIKEKFKTKKEIRIERLRIKALESIQENITVDESLNQKTIVKENIETISDNNLNSIKDEITSQRIWNRVVKLNTDRGINLSKQLIAVGNTSKFIQKESLIDKVTHKWLIYVQSKTEVPIEKFVKKVRFYLHPSYKPNDIIDVDSPPFQLARRGWGEFPVRIQLYFHLKFQQKPVQFYHNLVLDKTLSGLQTMGSETLVEIWLRSIVFSPQKSKVLTTPSEDYQSNNTFQICHEELYNMKKEPPTSPFTETKDNLIDFLNQIDPSLPTDLDSIEPTLILSPTTHTKLKSETISSLPIQNRYNVNMANLNQITVKKEFSDHTLSEPIEKSEINFPNSDTSFTDIFNINSEPLNSTWKEDFFCGKSQMNLPINIKNLNNKLKETIKTETQTSSTQENYTENNFRNHISDFQPNTQFENNSVCQNSSKIKFNNKNKIFLKDGKVSIIDPAQIKLKKKRKQISLLKPLIKSNQSILNPNKKQKFDFACLIDHDYTSPWKDEIHFEQNQIIVNKTEQNENSQLAKLKDEFDNPDLITSHDFISVVISDNTKQLINLKKKITLTVKEEPLSKEEPFIDYRGKFELKFHGKKFTTENNLIEYCLKNVPLINLKANDIHYKTAFPFVIKDLDTLKSLSLPKRRALEWLQCKYFSTLMKNHGQFSETLWSTKEIILFARAYGFSPIRLLSNWEHIHNDTKIYKNLNIDENKIVKEEEEKPLESKEDIYTWINEFSKDVENNQNIDKIIIEDDDDDENLSIKKSNIKSSPIQFNQNSIIIPIEEKYNEESKLIREICDQIGITFKPEKVVEGVHSNVSEIIFIKIFQNFLENLLRKSIFEIKNTNEYQNIPVIQVEHVKQAVLSNPDFKFLTNRIHKNLNEIKKEEI